MPAGAVRALTIVLRACALFLSAILAHAPLFASAPPNDNCSAGRAFLSAPFSDFQAATGATSEAADPAPQCGNGSSAKSVWYRFIAPASGGSLTVDTFGSDYDTILSAWSGVCGQLTSRPDGCNDDFGGSQSEIVVTVAGGEAVYLMVSAYFGDGGNLLVHASITSGSGTVTGLKVAKIAGGNVSVSWSPSCEGSDTDYEIVEGTMGSWTSYVPIACTTGGATAATMTPPVASSYYLVVPRNANREGSYGQTSTGAERAPSVSACLAQSLAGCPPACAHGKCVAGPELAPACDACVAQVCALDPYCCDIIWDGACVGEVRSVCSSLVCPDSKGTCAHGLCQTGSALTAQCDDPPVDPSCVTSICNVDSFCCDTVWDATCVQEVVGICGWNCN